MPGDPAALAVAPGAGNKNRLNAEVTPTPRLVLAVNTASTIDGEVNGKIKADGSADNNDANPAILGCAGGGGLVLPTLLAHVAKQLDQGLDKCWACDEGNPGNQVAGSDVEEQWARITSEILLLQPYGGSGTFYQSGFDDPAFFEMMSRKTNGCYPIASACQQLCTGALILRGFTAADFGTGINAGPCDSLPLFKSSGSKVIRNVTPDADSAVAGGVTPGSSFIWFHPQGVQRTDKNGKTFTQWGNNAGDHAAFVLRVRKADAKGPALQFLDTGGLNIDFNIETLVIVKDWKNYDFRWVQKGFHPGGSASFQYILVPPPSPNLPAAIARAKKLYPIGFGRLVVTARDTKKVVLHTPLMRMHDISLEEKNFSFARLLWSLRDTPFCDAFETSWQVSIPRGKLLEAFRDGQRRDLVIDLVNKTPKSSTKWESPIDDTSLLMRLCDVFVDTLGQVHVRKTNPQDRLPWGASTGVSALDLSVLPCPAFWKQAL